MSQANAQLKERVRQFWQEHPCGTKFADAPPGSRRFYELVEEHRYSKEWHIPGAAGFSETKNLRVLEIGCGLGTDGAQLAKAGAGYTGVDLTDAAVELAQKRFELFGCQNASHCRCRATPTFRMIRSISFTRTVCCTTLLIQLERSGSPSCFETKWSGGVMLYHRNSYNYRVNISVLRRGGVHMLRWNSGLKLVRLLTGESEEALRDHAQRLKKEREYLSSEDFSVRTQTVQVIRLREFIPNEKHKSCSKTFRTWNSESTF